MARDKLTEYDATAANNTVVGDVNLAENSALPSDMNNAVREVMSHLKEFADGTNGINVLTLADDDASASIKFQAPSAVTATVTFTLPDGDGADGQALITNGSGTLAWAYPYGNRNLIINGAMQVAQRSTSSSAGGYCALDRFFINLSGASATFSQETVTLGDSVVGDFINYARLNVTTGNNFCMIRHRVEDVQSVPEGTATISFYAKGTNPGGGVCTVQASQRFGTSGSSDVDIAGQTFTLTSSWQRFDFQFTIPSISGKTIGTGGTSFQFDIGQGSDTSTNAWQIDITGVQLEVGEQATPFDHSESYGETLAKCQRYYWQVAGSGLLVGQGFYYSSSEVDCIVNFPQTMRATPTFTSSNNSGDFGFMNNSDYFDTWTAQQFFDGSRVNVYTTSGVSGTAGYSGYIRMLNSTSKIQFDAEL